MSANELQNADLEVSLIIPARASANTLENTVREAHAFLSHHYPTSFEIILVPNPAPDDSTDPSLEMANELAQKMADVRSCPHFSPLGKGAALRTGFLASRGRFILFTDSDLPYNLDFFQAAIAELRRGIDLVTGNRRLPSSYFHIPVRLLPLAYGRHRLGLAFNQLVRFLLPIQTTDTQAGIKALSRRLVQEVCKRQACPGFLFDLEIFLIAQGLGFQRREFPVTLYLNNEKSTVKIIRECAWVAYWLTRISARNWMNAYGNYGNKKRKVLSRYREASWWTRFFLTARWILTPYSRMVERLPHQGTLLDLGCGHGLFTLAAALNSPNRSIVGIDHDSERVSLGAKATQDLPNIQIQKGNLTAPPSPDSPYSAIAMIDVMHYFDPETQEILLRNAYHLMNPGGVLLVREVDPEGGFASVWNRLYEKIATVTGLTQAEKKGLHFRSQLDWENLIKSAGFKVKVEKCSSFLFADILYTCERNS